MKRTFVTAFLLMILSCSSKSKDVDNGGGSGGGTNPTEPKDSTIAWITTPSKNYLFQKVQQVRQTGSNSANATIAIDASTAYQTIDGFGYTLTGGSALHLSQMTASVRKALLTELFGSDGNNLGVSYLRLTIGGSDLDEKVFSYDDLPSGVTADNTLQYFSIQQDQNYLIPMLKEILQINPNIKILGSPWSPPIWMKTNTNAKGGNLKIECYSVYAQYFVKYIQAMKAQGITIDAITVQNEPLNPDNTPSMYMPADEQRDFVKSALGPLFASSGISTKIIIYDHNADHTEYPMSILADADAAKYIDGSAFHLYGGSIDALGQVHSSYPDKNLYFTEQWVGAPGNMGTDFPQHIENVIIGSMRNWCRTALEWNLSSNPALTPHTDGGCTECLGAITLNGDIVTRNPAYYIIAHASKLVVPGSVRIASNTVSGMPNVAFKRPDGKIVLIVLNKNNAATSFNITYSGQSIQYKLDAVSAATFLL